MATVTARKRVRGTVWQVRWTDRGLRRRVSETFDTEPGHDQTRPRTSTLTTITFGQKAVGTAGQPVRTG